MWLGKIIWWWTVFPTNKEILMINILYFPFLYIVKRDSQWLSFLSSCYQNTSKRINLFYLTYITIFAISIQFICFRSMQLYFLMNVYLCLHRWQYQKKTFSSPKNNFFSCKSLHFEDSLLFNQVEAHFKIPIKIVDILLPLH